MTCQNCQNSQQNLANCPDCGCDCKLPDKPYTCDSITKFNTNLDSRLETNSTMTNQNSGKSILSLLRKTIEAFNCKFKFLMNIACGVVCIDNKTRNSVRVVNLWEGNQDVFSSPTMEMKESLTQFDYLDLHFHYGTERVVGRVSLEGGISNFATITLMDKVGANTTWNIDAGAMIAKEVGVQYPDATHVKLDHFIWSLTGTSGHALDTVAPSVYLALSSTAKTKEYSNTQDTVADRPHTVNKIEGIISRDTGSCL